MNDEPEKEFSELIEASDRPTAQIILEEDRPELVACLDGMPFRAGEDALALLLKGSILNLTSEIVAGLHEEAEISESIIDIEAQAAKLRLVARSLRWEVENQGPPRGDLRARSAAFRAEILELLHGPPPPIRLDRPELAILNRMAAASLKEEVSGEQEHAASQQQELQDLLDDLAVVTKTDFPYLVTRLSMARYLAWLDRWFDELRGMGPAASSDLEVVRGIKGRLEQEWISQSDVEAGRSGC